MIKELHLRNCQSHKDSLIKFNPGLNVLTGDTDAGKSAIIRGLDKIIYNSTPSKELVSHWGGPLVIDLKVDNNVLSFKHDKKDSYKLDKTEFNAVGGKVPEEVNAVLNMTEINLQNQINPFFLLNETSGFVASYLNEIANLSQIDSTTKSIKSELNQTKRLIEHDKESLKDKNLTLKSYAFIPELEKEIKEAEDLENKISDIEFQLEIIEKLLNEIIDLDYAIAKNKRLINLKPLIEETLNIREKIEKTESKINKLNNSLKYLRILDSQFTKLNRILVLKDLILSAIKVKKKQSDLQSKLDTLDTLLSKLTSIDSKIKTAISKRESEHELYHSELQKLDKCFFCGSKLNK